MTTAAGRTPSQLAAAALACLESGDDAGFQALQAEVDRLLQGGLVVYASTYALLTANRHCVMVQRRLDA